jgi:hypothetical protein
MHHLCTVRKVHISKAARRRNRTAGRVEICHSRHDVDDRFGRQTRYGSTANVLDRSRQPDSEITLQERPLASEQLRP